MDDPTPPPRGPLTATPETRPIKLGAIVARPAAVPEAPSGRRVGVIAAVAAAIAVLIGVVARLVT